MSEIAPPFPEGGSRVAPNVKTFDWGGEVLRSAAVLGKPAAGAPLVDTSVGQCGRAGGNRQVGAADLGGRRSTGGAEVSAQTQTHSGMVLGGTVRHTNHNPFLF